MIHKGLDRLRHKGLQQMTLDRQSKARHRSDMRRMAGYGDADPSAKMRPRLVSTPRTCPLR